MEKAKERRTYLILSSFLKTPFSWRSFRYISKSCSSGVDEKKQKVSTQRRYSYIFWSQTSRPLRLVPTHSCSQNISGPSSCKHLISTSSLFLARLSPCVRLNSSLLPRCPDERFTSCPPDSGPIPQLLISTHTTSNADPNSCITGDDQTHT